VLTDPVDTGAVVLSLPQDIQSHAFDFPAEFFAERDWVIRRPIADPVEVEAVARMIAAARKPIIIAGGGVIYSGATAELEHLAGSAGIPVLETMAGKGAVQQKAWWQIGGIGLEGTPVNNDLVREADLVLTVGSRLTDFPTASQSLFENPDVQFASINVNGYDTQRLGATGIVGDAKRALAALADEVGAAGFTSPQEWQERVRSAVEGWEPQRAAALDPDTPFDRASIPSDFPDIVPDTGALLTQGQVIGLMQEHARPGDTVVAAAGGPPGDLQKVWDATEGRFCHLEFGFSCMGYEIPAGMGVRLADPNPDSRVVVFIGDGTFLLSPTELVTAAQESIAVTVVIPENRGYQVIHRLQMGRHGREFGNEFRYRTSPLDLTAEKNGSQPRLDGDYLEVDIVQVAAGLGARAVRADTADEVRAALDETRGHQGPVVIVIPVIPHIDLPGAGAWWDVAPSEVSEDETVQRLRTEYEAGLSKQLWLG
jgi:3D-(3,5/4)-trihydroxycyclohexane-1,2-dione acylhydrolase (decyclizing)